MEWTWPSSNSFSLNLPKSKGKPKDKPSRRCYPNLESGMTGAITLVEDDDRLIWSSILEEPSAESSEKRLRIGDPVDAFPPTRAQPPRIPRLTVLQRAEQGANFLRTFLPDVDIAAELIRDQITQETMLARQQEDFDPYARNLVSTLRFSSSSHRGGYLAFPMGELRRELNLSSFIFSRQGVVTIQPSTLPAYSFSTPIQQIVFPARVLTNAAPCLAVRTHGSTTMLRLKPSDSLECLGTLSRTDIGNHEMMDMKLTVTPYEMVTVNERGLLHQTNFLHGAKSSKVIYKFLGDNDVEDPFWRIAISDRISECAILSSVNVEMLDTRSNSVSKIFSIVGTHELFTSIEDILGDNILRLCSTRDIIWVDQRFPSRPLLSYRHGRHFDRCLETWTIALETPLTFLSSRKNGLISVYNAGRSNNGLFRGAAPPYSLEPGSGDCGRYAGQAFLPQPLNNGTKASLNLVRLSERGAVQCYDIFSNRQKERPANVVASSNLQAIVADALEFRSDIGPLGVQDVNRVNLSPAYEGLFQLLTEDVELDEEHATALIERLPSYWKNVDIPVETVLTAFDVAFRTSGGPEQASRANFLAGCFLNSRRGYCALTQGRLPVVSLESGASWHHNITPTLRCLDGRLTSNVEELEELLHQYDLAHSTDRSATSLKLESTAREQLILDMALSCDVFSGQPFSKSPDVGQALEVMTEALSLGDEPPTVNFGYLHPTQKGPVESELQNFPSPLGVRLLLKEWDIGNDPEKYIYQDMYETSNWQLTRRTTPINPTKVSTMSQVSHHPPPILPSTSAFPPQNTVEQRLGFSSQQISGILINPGLSQELVANTQILPGVYGGRPGKKKGVKKRVGGF